MATTMPATDDKPVIPLTARDFKGQVDPDWCPGCGDFGVLNALQRSCAELGLRPHEILTVSGIGCSSNLPGYFNSYGMHTLHGRILEQTINGLHKTELIHKRGPWKSVDSLEWETLKWVTWFNHQRLLEPIGNRPPAEFEALYEQSQATISVAA